MIFEARNFIAAKSVELRAFSDKVQRGSVFFLGQNHAKRLGWRNKTHSRGMCLHEFPAKPSYTWAVLDVTWAGKDKAFD